MPSHVLLEKCESSRCRIWLSSDLGQADLVAKNCDIGVGLGVEINGRSQIRASCWRSNLQLWFTPWYLGAIWRPVKRSSAIHMPDPPCDWLARPRIYRTHKDYTKCPWNEHGVGNRWWNLIWKFTNNLGVISKYCVWDSFIPEPWFLQ